MSAQLHPETVATLAAVGAGTRWLCHCRRCTKPYSMPAGSCTHTCPWCGDLAYLRVLTTRVCQQMNAPHLELTVTNDQVVSLALALGEIDEGMAARLQNPPVGEPFELRWL